MIPWDGRYNQYLTIGRSFLKAKSTVFNFKKLLAKTITLAFKNLSSKYNLKHYFSLQVCKACMLMVKLTNILL